LYVFFALSTTYCAFILLVLLAVENVSWLTDDLGCWVGCGVEVRAGQIGKGDWPGLICENTLMRL